MLNIGNNLTSGSLGHQVTVAGSDLFIYTKNEAFDDLMEVLRNNGGASLLLYHNYSCFKRNHNFSAPHNASLNLINVNLQNGCILNQNHHSLSTGGFPGVTAMETGTTDETKLQPEDPSSISDINQNEPTTTENDNMQPLLMTSPSAGQHGNQFSMNAFSAQDMADLLCSDWFNVDSVLMNHATGHHQVYLVILIIIQKTVWD